jgi:4,5-DOPA dioxygenase extradiol
MERREFLKMATVLPFALDAAGAAGGSEANGNPRMPVLFVGHGSPMNAIEDNVYSREWKRLGAELPRPKAILSISAHWLTQGTYVTHASRPQTIHDFGGFPKELFAVEYPAPGSPEMAARVSEAVSEPRIAMDDRWGLDHGTWSVLKHMYPKADIPVLQLSIDYHQPPQYHYDLGRRLGELRKQGVLIVGSGNMVHNLRMVAFDRIDDAGYGFDWALEIDEQFKKHILKGDHGPLIHYEKFGKPAQLAVPTPDHYYPLLYVLGLQEKGEAATLFNEGAVAGSLTMTSVKIG